MNPEEHTKMQANIRAKLMTQKMKTYIPVTNIKRVH